MAPLVIMIVLVCGFWYTENHYPSRIRQARSNGWLSYFHVAMHGCRFVIEGFFTTFALYIGLFLFSKLASLPHLLSEKWPVYDWYTWLSIGEIFSYPLFLIVSMLFGCFIAYGTGVSARRAMEKSSSRLDAYRKVAETDGIESLLVQAIDENKLLFVTLKSRKVYIGYVAAPRIEHSHTQHIALIPYMSGYRDKDTLAYHEQTRYYELYLKKNITADSTPLNLQHFRYIIPMDQVESVSLFDIDAYESFPQSGSN